MKQLFTNADEIPVTLLVAIAYVTLAFLTDPFDPTVAQLAAWGWLMPMDAAAGEPWRLLSHAFLHGGILHLAFNTMFLLSIGPSLERSMGSVRFFVLYVVSSVGGGLAVCLVNEPLQPVVGGSGALFGMMGALIAWNMHSGRHLFSFLEFEGPRRLLSLIAVNLVLGFLIPFVSNTGHIGGLIAGFAVTFLWLAPARNTSATRRHWQAAMLALFASFCLAALRPVWRWDHVFHLAEEAQGPRQQQFERALVRAREGDRAGEEIDQRVARAYMEERRMFLADVRKQLGG